MVEMAVVLGIMAVLASIAFFAVSRSHDKTRIERGARELQARVANARSLAENAGPRLGTPRFNNCGGGQPNLEVTIDPGAQSYTVPVNLRYDALTDTMTSECDTFGIASETNNLGQLVTGTGAAFVVAFSGLGRVDFGASTPAGLLPGDLLVRLQKTTDAQDGYGFRILPSGIICRADQVGVVACHED
jgi:Tfp pilus assembly protein FimT